jgi:hypothetical protein
VRESIPSSAALEKIRLIYDYLPSVEDIITFDASAGAGYTLSTGLDQFQYAKVIGSATTGGTVLLNGPWTNLFDDYFANMYQGNISTLYMQVGSNNGATLGEMALASGLRTLKMSTGNDTIDVSAFFGTLAVDGGGGNDLVKTSFAALSKLTFTGGAGNDTLQIVGADARSITSLAGNFEALALNAGNNFVMLGNDAGLSTIYGGSGNDTINMLNNTTGIDFVMDASKLSKVSNAAMLIGGSGSDTLSIINLGVGGNFIDDQFFRVGSVGYAGDIGAIESFETESSKNGSYIFATTAYAAGFRNIYGHSGDVLNASGFRFGNSPCFN